MTHSKQQRAEKPSCPVCGGTILGDGYTTPMACENAAVPLDRECDAPVLYCSVLPAGWDRLSERAKSEMLDTWKLRARRYLLRGINQLAPVEKVYLKEIMDTLHAVGEEL